MERLIAIVGPTASGKSRIAHELALRLGGEIVNGDSRQVYSAMQIGTAGPGADEMSAVRHHLYAFRDPRDSYSLALYQRDAEAALDAIWQRGSFPWLVGGTGQYVWSLLEAWSVPEVPPDVDLRATLSQRAAREGNHVLHAELAAIDPAAAAKIGPENVRRVVRAIEVFKLTGRRISDWQTKGEPRFGCLLFGIDVPLDELERRIDARVDGMFAAGFVGEVEALLASGLTLADSAMGSIGYSQVAAHLLGECTLESAVEETKRATRRLARNQFKWFRKNDPRIRWVKDASDIEMEANIFTGACTNAMRGASRW